MIFRRFYDARPAVSTAAADPIRLHGWALILGASSGFGAAMSRALAGAGLNIFGVHLDRRATLPAAERLVEEIRALGREARFFNVNAADHDRRAETAGEMQRLLAERNEMGQLRVLMHSLAFGTLKPYVAGDMSLDVMAHRKVVSPEATAAAVCVLGIDWMPERSTSEKRAPL